MNLHNIDKGNFNLIDADTARNSRRNTKSPGDWPISYGFNLKAKYCFMKYQ